MTRDLAVRVLHEAREAILTAAEHTHLTTGQRPTTDEAAADVVAAWTESAHRLGLPDDDLELMLGAVGYAAEEIDTELRAALS